MRSFLAVYPWFLLDMPLLFPDPAPGTALSFFPCYLMAPKRVTNATFAASERFCHFRLICIRMFCHICLQFFRIDLSKIPMQLILFQPPRFLQPLFPFPYGQYGYFEYLMCLFQCMPCLPIFYCPFPVISWITHASILSHPLIVFNHGYYNILIFLSSSLSMWQVISEAGQEFIKFRFIQMIRLQRISIQFIHTIKDIEPVSSFFRWKAVLCPIYRLVVIKMAALIAQNRRSCNYKYIKCTHYCNVFYYPVEWMSFPLILSKIAENGCNVLINWSSRNWQTLFVNGVVPPYDSQSLYNSGTILLALVKVTV